MASDFNYGFKITNKGHVIEKLKKWFEEIVKRENIVKEKRKYRKE